VAHANALGSPPGELRRRLAALVADAAAANIATAPELAARLGETEQRISRLVEALAAGSDDLPSVRQALVGLERERARLAADLATARKRIGGEPATGAIVDAMLAALAQLPDVLAASDAEDRKAVVRAFLAGVQVDHGRGRATLRWYHVPRLEGACGNVGGGGGNRTHVRKPSAAGVYVDSRFILLLSRPSALHPAGGPRDQPHVSRPSPEARFRASHRNMTPVPRPR